MIKVAKWIAWISLGVMTVGLLNGFINGDFLVDGAALLANLWGIMSMIDLYVGFTWFSMWIVFRESNRYVAIIWVIAMMILGFFTGALYILFVLYTSKDSWPHVMMGKHSQ